MTSTGKRTSITAVLVLALSLGAGTASALDILLTNDDGYNAVGINSVYTALVNAGHNVTMVAPMNNQSGKAMAWSSDPSVAYTFGRVPGTTTKWFFDGTPVDTIQVGLDVVLAGNPPDLVISGSNIGENAGALTNQSGTVGAALKALQRGIPAIAISVQRNATNAMFDDAAQFLVRLVDQLTVTGAPALPWWCDYVPTNPICLAPALAVKLPTGAGLNVNYPARAASQVVGVVFARVAKYTTLDFSFGYENSIEDGVLYLTFNGSAPPPPAPQPEDLRKLYAGNITISPISWDLNASTIERFSVADSLGDLITEGAPQ